jgi:hypothetical protein
MARETGGAYYEVRKDRTIEDIYAQIEESLRNQYSIGYTPERAAADGKYHIIKLTTITPNQWEFPRLCRGGSRTLRIPGVCSPSIACAGQ